MEVNRACTFIIFVFKALNKIAYCLNESNWHCKRITIFMEDFFTSLYGTALKTGFGLDQGLDDGHCGCCVVPMFKNASIL